MGSQLTAIDVANALVGHGHRGNITFISRSSWLPKSQAQNPIQFQRQLALHCLARELEERPKGALCLLMTQFQKEIEEEGTDDFSVLTGGFDALQTLRSDISAAESGPIPWQTVLYATKALVERYWNCFSAEEKKYWQEYFNNAWYIYRHSIPLANAHKILKHLESGQLQVLKGSKVEWDGTKFVLNSEGTEHQAISSSRRLVKNSTL
jgi:uncharacterized NAD(P)/FAD-binding protein YdhS